MVFRVFRGCGFEFEPYSSPAGTRQRLSVQAQRMCGLLLVPPYRYKP